jgi:GMP synthase (glutamine-hydrolysing)
MAIIVFQHGEHVGPGRLGLTLRDHGFKLDIRRLDLPADHALNRTIAGPLVPKDYDNVQAVISLGGEQNIGDPLPWIEQEAAYIKGAHERNIPVVGICLGAQLITHALGGKVAPLPNNFYEIGIENLALNIGGQTESMLGGIAWNSPQFMHHGYWCETLPAGAAVLASSKNCKHQIFRVGVRTYGFQFHPECDRGGIDEYLRGAEAYMTRGGTSREVIAKQIEEHYAAYARLSDRLCVNIATLLFPASKRISA